MSASPRPIEMIAILMGVSGSGKTTVGRVLARRLGWSFKDADDLHPQHNIEKMRSGLALTDDDRRPWLEAVRELVERCLAENRNAVIACSALKQAYRELINPDPARVRLVYLKGSREVIAERMARRRGHFFDPGLLQSQLETLEEPTDAIVADISGAPEQIADRIVAALAL
jgi:gluconokinase